MKGFLLFLLFTFSLSANETDKAIEFLKSACVSSGETIKIEATGQGDITFLKLNKAGISGKFVVKKENVEGMPTSLNAVSAKQASEIRECMKPHIDKILNIILKQHSSLNNSCNKNIMLISKDTLGAVNTDIYQSLEFKNETEKQSLMQKNMIKEILAGTKVCYEGEHSFNFYRARVSLPDGNKYWIDDRVLVHIE